MGNRIIKICRFGIAESFTKLINFSFLKGEYYYIHFEINGVSCNLIGSQECDFSKNRNPSGAISARIAHFLM
jgi:hypothetical protein